MYQNEQPTGTEPENNQFTNNNDNEYQNNYTGNDYTGNNYNGNNYAGNNNNGNNYTGNNNNGNNYTGNNYNGNYQVPYQQNSPVDLEEPMKVGEWLISLLIMMVPCVNIVMMFVWAFSSTEKKSKSNFFKAELIFMGIILVLYLILIIAVAALGVSTFSRYY